MNPYRTPDDGQRCDACDGRGPLECGLFRVGLHCSNECYWKLPPLTIPAVPLPEKLPPLPGFGWPEEAHAQP